MARIRTIKPEYWKSEQPCSCSRDARLLFLGMLNFVDCNGIFPASPFKIKNEVFPADNDLDTTAVSKLIDELINANLIVEYSVNGESYWVIPTFKKHQIIHKPKYQWPLPEGQSELSMEFHGIPPNSMMEREREREGERENIYNLNYIRNSRVVADRRSEVQFKIPLKGRGHLSITKLEITHWQKIYKLINVQEVLNKIHEYYTAQPKKRRTLEEMQQRITSWLGEDQEKAKSEARSKKHATTTTTFKSHSDEVRAMQLEYRAKERAMANARSA